MLKIDDQAVWPGWKTVRTLGNGSFGAVYEIERDVFGEKEKAALKVISIPQKSSDIDELYGEGYDDESITSTFQSYLKSIIAEYTLMRKMNGSANVVNCDDVKYFQHEDGFGWDIFIKMELLTPITKKLQKDIPEEQVIRLGSDICKALVLCKKHSIIHRDIKPANIFVSDNGDYKLGDFGIAKTVEKTSGGTMIGTYDYMAPEVYHDQPYGSAVDIYSLGIVLYWLLNERRTPFLKLPPALPTSSEKENARRLRFRGEPIPAPAHGSEEIQRIVLKACAFDPEDRYQSAEEMLQDLEELRKRRERDAELVKTYDRAVDAMHKASTEDEYNSAAKLFESILGFKDSDALAEQCLTKAEELRKDAILAEVSSVLAKGDAEKHQLEHALELLKTIPGWKNADDLAAKCKEKIREIDTQSEEDHPNPIPSGKRRRILIPIVAVCIVLCFIIIVIVPMIKGMIKGKIGIQIPAGGVLWNYAAHSYYLIDEPMTWTEACEFASSTGGYLVTITTQGEQDSVREHIESSGTANTYWLGGYRAILNDSSASKNSFVWVTGEPFKYNNWEAGEPNNNDGHENYIEMFRIHPFGREAYVWNDSGNNAFGSSNVGLIIEFDSIITEEFIQGRENNGTGYSFFESNYNIKQIFSGDNIGIVLFNDGTIAEMDYSNSNYSTIEYIGSCKERWKDITCLDVSLRSDHIIALKTDGTVLSDEGTIDWEGVTYVAVGHNHYLGLLDTGRVVAKLSDTVTDGGDKGQCDVSADNGWKNIVKIAAGTYVSVGLNTEGTVVACGNDSTGTPDVGSWTDIIDICVGEMHTVGLRRDGTVVATGNNADGQCDVSEWRDIVAIAAGGHFTLGLKTDGTIVTTGSNYAGQLDVSDWNGIKQIDAGLFRSNGLLYSGIILNAGCSWSDGRQRNQ